jgi:signal transducing adaptor molecule
MIFEQKLITVMKFKVKEQNQTPSLYYSTLQTSPNAEPKTQIKVKALYDFEAVEDNELTFKADDIIILIEECDPNWWEGSLNGKSGEILSSSIFSNNILGLFPANFVTKTLDVKTEPPKKTENKVVIKVDEALLDKTLEQVESADPSEENDSPEMLQNEEICSKMGKFHLKNELCL